LSLNIDLRKLRAIGTGVGIEIREQDLEVAVVRVRPSKVQVLARRTMHGFRERPAAEWGAEYAQLLREVGAGHLSATVLLPRREVIVRQISLPGVSAKDLDSAIALQLDTLHPYDEGDALAGWAALEHGAVLVGIARRETVDRYQSLFAEAGIAVWAFTFSASAIHAAIRLMKAPPAGGFLALGVGESGAVAVYGESDARPVFSTELDLPAEKAAVLALAELRLPPDTPPMPLEELLPAPAVNPVENDLARNALPYTAALASVSRRSATANLLPPDQRSASSRAMFIPTAVLASILLLLLGATLAYSAWEQRQYLRQIDTEIAQLEPEAKKAASLDRAIDRARNRTRLLDEFRGRTRADLEALNELSRLLPASAWTNMVELMRDSATLVGEAEQAAALLKVLDASPYFQGSEFVVITRTSTNEQFRIRTTREQHK